MPVEKSLASGKVAIVAGLLAAASGMIGAKPTRAQSGTADSPTAELRFASSSIKQEAKFGMDAVGRFTPDGYSGYHVTLRSLIKDAYGVGDNQILGGPGWAGSTEYQLDAKIDGVAVEALGKLGAEEARVARREMLKALLADRFRLTLHTTSKTMPVYTLVSVKSGPRLRRATPGDTYSNGLKNPTTGGPLGPGRMLARRIDGTSGDGGEIAGQGMPFKILVRQLSSHVGQNINDSTGLTGNYDFDLQWGLHPGEDGPVAGPDVSQHRDNNGAAPVAPGLSFFVAIEQQLGLKLDATNAAVDCLVIDRAEKPKGN